MTFILLFVVEYLMLKGRGGDKVKKKTQKNKIKPVLGFPLTMGVKLTESPSWYLGAQSKPRLYSLRL